MHTYHQLLHQLPSLAQRHAHELDQLIEHLTDETAIEAARVSPVAIRAAMTRLEQHQPIGTLRLLGALSDALDTALSS